MQNSGYRQTLTYKCPKNDNNNTNINKIKQKRKQQIIWFNSPFNSKTKTKTGKLILNLLDKHFPADSKLHKIFNQTNVKISYGCMPKMNSYSYIHNHKVLNDKPNETGIKNCNCCNEDTCPLPNSCHMKCITYQANIDCDITGYTNVTLAHKSVLEVIKSCWAMLNIKMIWNYQMNFGKSKSIMKIIGNYQNMPFLQSNLYNPAFYI